MDNDYTDISEQDRSQEILFSNFARGIWRTKDGRNLHVSKMSDDHLIRTRSLLTRVGDPANFTNHINNEIERRKHK